MGRTRAAAARVRPIPGPPGPWPRCYPDALRRHPIDRYRRWAVPSRAGTIRAGPLLIAAPALVLDLRATPSGDTAARSTPVAATSWRSAVPGVPGRSRRLARPSVRRLAFLCAGEVRRPSRADANQGYAEPGEGSAPSRFRPRRMRGQQMKILQRPRRQAPAAAASRPAGRPGPFEVTPHQRRSVRRNPAQQTRGTPRHR